MTDPDLGPFFVPIPDYTSRRYTLEEARRELERIECQRSGHDFSIVVVSCAEPVAIECRRCGRNWTVRRREQAST